MEEYDEGDDINPTKATILTKDGVKTMKFGPDGQTTGVTNEPAPAVYQSNASFKRIRKKNR